MEGAPGAVIDVEPAARFVDGQTGIQQAELAGQLVGADAHGETAPQPAALGKSGIECLAQAAELVGVVTPPTNGALALAIWEPLAHLLYHAALTYSNWESVTVCFSESFEALSEGLQNALWDLGGVPARHR